MKKLFFASAALLLFTAFQSCSKCGHCHYETTYTGVAGTQTNKSDGSVVCGNSTNESGSYEKQAELNCKNWASRQTVITGTTYTSTWVADK
jgi:hypothetical protein